MREILLIVIGLVCFSASGGFAYAGTCFPSDNGMMVWFTLASIFAGTGALASFSCAAIMIGWRIVKEQ